MEIQERQPSPSRRIRPGSIQRAAVPGAAALSLAGDGGGGNAAIPSQERENGAARTREGGRCTLAGR